MAPANASTLRVVMPLPRAHHNPTHKARKRPVLARRSRLKPRLQLRVNRYVVKLADGSSTVEGWGPKGWTPGGASFGEIFDAPPVGRAFASELGIPLSDRGGQAAVAAVAARSRLVRDRRHHR